MGTIKFVSNARHTQNVFDQCSGVSMSQLSICLFLLIMMIIKVVIAPLSTTTITANDLIKLNLPRRLIFEGALFGLSFLFNPYLFANMDKGKVTDNILAISFAAYTLALISLFLEFFHMVFHRDHRTSLVQTSIAFPSGENSLSPTDNLSQSPTESGVIAGFI